MFHRQIKRKILLLPYLLVLLALIGCVSKSNRFGIVFTSDFEGLFDIYRIPDTIQSKAIERLTFTPIIGEYQFLVSKDGNKIVFETGPAHLKEEAFMPEEPEDLWQIYFLDAKDKTLIDITESLTGYKRSHYNAIDWLPDQKRFVVIASEGVEFEIKSFLKFIDIDGKNRKDIFVPTTDEIPSVITSVKWSPDGSKLVLTREAIGIEQQLQNPGSAILLYDLRSQKLTHLTDYKDRCFPMEWSPNSKQIVVICSFPYVEGVSSTILRILDSENPGQTYEHIAFTDCYDPSWSPNGQKIAFVCKKAKDQAGLFIASSNGSGIREVKLAVSENPAVIKDPTWSPDGAQILYVAGTDSEHTLIYSIYSDGSNNYPLTNQEAFYSIISAYPVVP